MRIVFASNFLNHHQKPLADLLYNKPGMEYTFIATERITLERKKLGYAEQTAPYLLEVHDDKEKYNEAKQIINDADVVIYGSAPYDLIRERIKNGKPVIVYSERLFKKSDNIIEVLLRKVKYGHYYGKCKNVYLLCSSAYAAEDYNRIGLFKNKTYRWGYFPEIAKYDDVDALLEKKKNNSFIWVGNLIDWKHPELTVTLAEKLRDDGIDFELNIIGEGTLKETIIELVKQKRLGDKFHVLGGMPQEKVRAYMERSQFHLTTSNRREGFGVTLLESMSSLCIPVADYAIGAVPFLLKDKENGLIYKDGDILSLYETIKDLLEDNSRKTSLAKNAYKTVREEWNPENAAERLVYLISDLLEKGKSNRYSNGPCSRMNVK